MDQDFEKNKKLAKFFKTTKNPSKRMKCLVAFIDNVAESDLRVLFHNHYSVIYAVFLDALQLMELNSSSNKGKGEKNTEVIALFDTFRRLLVYERELIGTRWQSKSIVNVISRMLHPANKHFVRLLGITNTFHFLDAVGHPPPNPDDLDLINYFVIIPAFYDGAPPGGRAPQAPPYSFVTQIGAPTAEEALECLDRVYNLVSGTEQHFDAWFQYIRERLLAFVYPLPRKDGNAPCPPIVQRSTIRHFRNWARDKQFLPSLGSNEDRMAVTMEVFRQGCGLPLTELDAIQSTLKTYYSWVKGIDRPPYMHENWPAHERQIVTNLSALFDARGRQMVDEHVSICQAGLGLLRLISQTTLVPDTWLVLLKTLVNLTNNMVANYGTSTSSSSSTGKTVGREIATPLMQLLFNTWIRAPAIDGIEDLWATFRKRLPQWLHCPATMVSWRRAVVLVTRELLASVYGGELGDGSAASAQTPSRGPRQTDPANLFQNRPSQPSPTSTKEKEKGSGKEKKRSSMWSSSPSGGDKNADNVMFTPEVSAQAESNELAQLSDMGTGLYDSYDPLKSWTTEALFNQWEHLLVVIGNPNEFTDSTTHSTAFACLADLVNLFFNEQGLRPQHAPADQDTEGQGTAADASTGGGGRDSLQIPPQRRRRSPSTSRPRAALVAHGPPPSLKCGNTLLSVFGPWLFEACTAVNPRLVDGTALAFSALCRLVCRQSDDEITAGRLAAFYRIVQEGLAQGGQIAASIILHSDNIFSLGFPGVTLLVPAYLKAVRVAMGSVDSSPDLQDACVRMAMSMVFIPSHYSSVSVPDLDDIATWRRAGIAGDLDDDAGRNLSFEEMEEDLAKLIPTLPEKAITPPTKQMCLWGLAVLVYHTQNATVLTSAVKVVRQHVFGSTTSVVSCALQVLAVLSTKYEKIARTDMALPSLVVTGLCQNIALRLEQGASDYATIIGASLDTLVSWVLEASSDLMADSTISEKVYEALQSCIHHASSPIREAGHDAMIQLLACQSTFPVTSGTPSGLFDDHLSPGCDAPWFESSARMFAVDDAILLSICDSETSPGSSDDKSGEMTVNILLRSPVSQFLWRQVLNLNDGLAPIVPPEPVSMAIAPSPTPAVPESPKPESKEEDATSSLTAPAGDGEASPSAGEGEAEDGDEAEKEGEERAEGETATAKEEGGEGASNDDVESREEVTQHAPPLPADAPAVTDCTFSEDRCGYEVDMLSDYLSYLNNAYPETTADAEEVSVEAGTGIQVKIAEYERVEELLLEQANAEADYIASTAEDGQPKRGTLAVQPPQVTPAVDAIAKAPFSAGRQFLAQLGLFSPAMLHRVRVIEPTDAALTAVRGVDLIPSRPVFTASVVYVRDGQMLADEILANEGVGSPKYEQFLEGLGWQVDLASHRGFMGGLDTSSSGSVAVYHAGPRHELMFHTLTLIPSNPREGSEQSHKRVHLVNDRVVIVFNEHVRDFWTGSVRAPTALVFIVVSPLPTGQYHVNVITELECVLGPLVDGMIVSSSQLATLVRLTAIAAQQAIQRRDSAERPSSQRAAAIRKVISQHAVTVPPQQFISALVTLDHPEATVL